MPGQWERFLEFCYRDEALGIALDISRMSFPADFFDRMEAPIQAAFAAMAALEKGSIANPDEGRQVGHYWLRTPELAPDPEVRRDVEQVRADVIDFAKRVHDGRLAPQNGGRFRNLITIGIGGSALGPQLLADALGGSGQAMRPYFLDNTDPDGMDRVYAEIGEGLSQTLTLVISKSGETKETQNGMIETETAYRRRGLEFARQAVAVTRRGSELDRHAESAGWLRRFPMWDWVGGRTSIFSAVGLLPAALMGFDTEGLVSGARDMDAATRVWEAPRNPAALLALMWHYSGGGHGDKNMVVLPYRDRLQLFPRYLQQLVMESLGKELDLQGRTVNQGIVVYGNKGSTDQHAYVQQLRGGANDFFVTFIEVLRDGDDTPVELEPGITSGDYLSGFLQGTRQALTEKGRESLTITLDSLDAAAVGRLIALFDRAVGFYASLVGINAYDQPAVQAGKQAAEDVIALQANVIAALVSAGKEMTAEEVAMAAGAPSRVDAVYNLLKRLSANPKRGVAAAIGDGPATDRFHAVTTA